MRLKNRINQLKEEYERYKNITETFKLQDGTEINIQTLDKSKILNNIGNNLLQKIYERKLILQEILRAAEQSNFKDKEKKLQSRLEKNDSYFANINVKETANIKNFFEKAAENLAGTEAWQSYHMTFTALQGLDLQKQIEDYIVERNLRQAKKDAVEQRRKEVRDIAKRIQQKYPKEDPKDFISNYDEDEKNYSKLYEKYQNLEKEVGEDKKKLDEKKEKVDGYERALRELEDRIKNEDENLTYLKTGLENVEKRKDVIETCEKDIAKHSGEINKINQELEPFRKEKAQFKQAREQEKKLLRDHVKNYNHNELTEYVDMVTAQQDMLFELKEIGMFRARVASQFQHLRLGENDGEYKDLLPMEEVVKKYSLEKTMKDNSYEAIFEALEAKYNDYSLEVENRRMIWEQKIPSPARKLCNKYLKEEVILQNAEKYSLIVEKIDEKLNAMEHHKEAVQSQKAMIGTEMKPCFSTTEAGYSLLAGVNPADYAKKAKEMIETIEKGRSDLNQTVEQSRKLWETEKNSYQQDSITYSNKNSDRNSAYIDAKSLQDKLEERKDEYQALKAAKEEYKKTYKEVFTNTKSIEIVNLEEQIKREAGVWLGKKDLHASRHSNSVEFDRMANAAALVNNWPDEKGDYLKNIPERSRPTTLEGALDYLKKQAEEYKLAKSKQKRIFETTLRVTRKNMADHLIHYAEKRKEGLVAVKELEKLNAYFENKGKENVKEENIKGGNVKEERQIEDFDMEEDGMENTK